MSRIVEQTTQAGRSDGLTQPETFTSTVTTGATMKRMIPLLVLMFLVSAVMFSLVVGAIGLPAITGVILAVAFCAFMFVAKRRQLDTKGQHSLVLSPTGAVMSDLYSRVDLPWERVRSIGEVELMRAIRTPTGSSPLAEIGTAVVRGTHDTMMGTRAHGLVGGGLLTLTPAAPALLKIQVKQFLGDGPADPAIGQRPMGIPLAPFDPDWQNGRIGRWVREYRPDLAGGPPPREGVR